MYEGAHNAGNDAVKTLRAGIALALDSLIGVDRFNEDYDSDLEPAPEGEVDAEDEYLSCFNKWDKIDQALVADNPAAISEVYNNTRPLTDIKLTLLISLGLELK